MTDITICVKDDIDLNGSLVDAISLLQGLLDEVPYAYQDAVILEVDSDYESFSAYGRASYVRPMTDEEEAVEAANQARYNQYRLKAERDQYEALKKKFGD